MTSVASELVSVAGQGNLILGGDVASSASVRAPTNPYAIHLGFFSGPLDLLLHLVRQKEVQIEEVEMAGIAEQYLRVIAHSALIDLESASEYLVIAATLLAIKSRSLLPSEEKDEGEVGTEEMGDAFYEELRQRLKQYQLTQARAQTLVGAAQLDVNVFVRKDRSAVPTAATDIEDGQDPLTLAQGFYRLLKRIGASMRVIRIHLEPISIVSYMMKVVDKARGFILTRTPASFKNISGSLYRDELAKGGVPKSETRRAIVIGSLIAVLELAKRGLVSVVKDPLSNAFSIGIVDEESKPVDDFTALSGDIESEWSLSSDSNVGESFPSSEFAKRAEEQTISEAQADEIQESLPLIELEGNDKVIVMSRYRREKMRAEKLELEQAADDASSKSANDIVRG